MSNNRHYINDSDIIRPPMTVEKGLPIRFLDGKQRIDEGWCAVLTEGGAFKEILEAGTHFMGKYHVFRDVRVTLVDTRMTTLEVKTTNELQIARPVAVKLHIDVSVEFRICDPRRVVTEVRTPMTTLWDRTVQAERAVLANADVEEVRTQSENIRRGILQQLLGMQLPRTLGIEVFNVWLPVLEVTDTGQDVLAAQQLKEYTTVSDWRLDAALLSQTQVTDAWLAVHRPELLAQKMAGNAMLFKELIDKGYFDTAAMMNQAVGTPAFDPRQALGGAMGFGGLQTPSDNAPQGAALSGSGFVPGQPAALPEHDQQARIKEDLRLLRLMPGAQVSLTAGLDSDGLQDGSYIVEVTLPRAGGTALWIAIACPVAFPQAPPELEVEVDGSTTPFNSSLLSHWRGNNYLVDLVREVQQRFG